jgi:hypothetical protein
MRFVLADGPGERDQIVVVGRYGRCFPLTIECFIFIIYPACMEGRRLSRWGDVRVLLTKADSRQGPKEMGGWIGWIGRLLMR